MARSLPLLLLMKSSLYMLIVIKTALLCVSIALVSCTNKNKQNTDQSDTATGINIYPTDSNVPVDTDNHNTGHTSTIALDSPVGPPKHLDTTKLIEPERY